MALDERECSKIYHLILLFTPYITLVFYSNMNGAGTVLEERTPPAGASVDDVTNTESPDSPSQASEKDAPLESGKPTSFRSSSF